MAVDQVVVEDMVDYMMKLYKEFHKKGFPPEFAMHVFSLFVFHQFNGTRNDTARAFYNIVDRLNQEIEKENKKQQGGGK